MLETIHHRICPLCEACCGLEIKVQGGKVTSIKGHVQDVFSAGYVLSLIHISEPTRPY